MKTINLIRKNTRFLMFLKTTMILLVLVSSCKKDDDDLDEELPIFGTCEPVTPKGNLSISGTENGIFTYITSGGGKIVIDTEKYYAYTFTHSDYAGFSIQFWGAVSIDDNLVMGGGHENLNFKHVKDIANTHKTLIFPDGTKFTLWFEIIFGRAMSATIYDGKQCHHINFYCNTLEYSEANSSFVQQIDNGEVDGETSTFEFTDTGLLYLNIYTENTPGKKIEKRVNIGALHKDEPTRVDDLWP